MKNLIQDDKVLVIVSILLITLSLIITGAVGAKVSDEVGQLIAMAFSALSGMAVGSAIGKGPFLTVLKIFN